MASVVSRFGSGHSQGRAAQYGRTAALELVHLSHLMTRTTGSAETKVGVVDGPVATDHPDLAGSNIREISSGSVGEHGQAYSPARLHGTFVAGILAARRDSVAPAICPGCTLLVRPIFSQSPSQNLELPSASPETLAAAIVDCVEAGAAVINLSVAVDQPSSSRNYELEEALNYAARHDAVVVAAAGNQGTVASSAITRHPWVVPVVACDLKGRPMGHSNLGASSGRHGLAAPGEEITSLGTPGRPLTLGGTSAAAPFVSGTVALLRGEFPALTGAEIKRAVVEGGVGRRHTVVPPLLNAWATYRAIVTGHERGPWSERERG